MPAIVFSFSALLLVKISNRGLVPYARLSLFLSDGAANDQSRSEEKEILHQILSLQTRHPWKLNKTDVGS